jgi:hypothetical protein
MKVATRLFLLETPLNRNGSKEFTLCCQVIASSQWEIQVHNRVHPLEVLVWFTPNFLSMYEVVTFYVFRRGLTWAYLLHTFQTPARVWQWENTRKIKTQRNYTTGRWRTIQNQKLHHSKCPSAIARSHQQRCPMWATCPGIILRLRNRREDNIKTKDKQGVAGFISEIAVTIKMWLSGLQLGIPSTVWYKLLMRISVPRIELCGDKMRRMKEDKCEKR